MKIAMIDFVCEPDKPGQSGLSDVSWNWASQLLLLGDEVHIVAPYTTEDYPDKNVHVHRFKIPHLGYRNIIGYTLIILKAWGELKKIKDIDIIHLPEYHSSAILSLLVRDIPIVVTPPGNIYERIQHGNPYDWVTTQVYKVAAKISARRCRHIIAISNDMKKWWEFTGAESSKITVIPNGIDTSFFKPYSNAREHLNLDVNSKIILYAGRLSHEKGLKYLLDAVKNIKKEFKDLQLYIVGEDPEEENLKEYARKLKIDNVVKFRGWISKRELVYFYSAADVVVVPSLSEPFGRVPIEAMACGKPVVGSNVGGIPDYLNDGVTGFLTEPKNIDALSEKIKMILEDKELAERLAENAYNYVLENLTWEKVAKRTQKEVYEKLINKQGF